MLGLSNINLKNGGNKIMAVDTNTISLLQLDNNLNDDCGLNWASGGTLKFDTNTKKFGSSSMIFDGAQYLKLASSKDVVAFGAGDYTIECWIYLTQHQSGYCIIYMDSNYHLQVGLNSGKPYLGYAGSGSSGAAVFSSYTVPLNTWVHLAVVRYNGVTNLFADGNIVAAYTGSYMVVTPAEFTVGTHAVEFNAYNFIGYIDNFQISNVARYFESNPLAVPTNLTATAGDSQVTLSWAAVTGATGYNVKRSTTAGGPYTTIATKVTGTTYVDKTVTNCTTYYYVVTAVDGSGNESANSNEAFATPVATQVPTGQALLRVTMLDSSEREYQLSNIEIDGFINWYNRTVGTGTTSYVLNKNIGLQFSKEYLAFDKIISFEVIPLTK
jgi:hypothetical protein